MGYITQPGIVKIDPTVTNLRPDQFDNDEPIQVYPFGPSTMRVTSATGFPEASGDVITSRSTEDTGNQIFVGDKTYFRTFGMSGWSSWRELGSVSGVTSVNGKTGDVVLTAEDVGAETPDGAQTKADQAEQNAKGYTDQEVSKVQDDLDAHKAENTQNAHLAKNIGIEDTAGNFTATDVEGALSELFTNVSDGKNLIAAAITDMGGTASGSDTFQQLADAIRAISTGKKWASGTTTPSSSYFQFTYANGTIVSSGVRRVLVTGLDFQPNSVIIYSLIDNYFTILFPENIFSAGTNSGRIITGDYHTNAVGGINYIFRLTGNAYVSQEGFSLPFVGAQEEVRWIAFE